MTVLLQCVLQLLLTYFALNMQGGFFGLLFTCFVLGMLSSMVGLVVGISAPSVSTAIAFAPLLQVPQTCFSGIFIKLSHIPFYFQWLQYISPLRFSMVLFGYFEFKNLQAESLQKEVIEAWLLAKGVSLGMGTLCLTLLSISIFALFMITLAIKLLKREGEYALK